MSHKNKYKTRDLVSNIPGLAQFDYEFLLGPAGIDFDNHTIWATNNDEQNKGITHYKFDGFPLNERPLFIFFPAPLGRFSLLIELLYDILHLERDITIKRQNPPTQIPVRNNRAFEPLI